MNKARRHELKMLKYKKRLSQLNLKDGEGKFFAYRSHGAPCSCSICSHTKHKREVKHPLQDLMDQQIDLDPIFNVPYDKLWDLI